MSKRSKTIVDNIDVNDTPIGMIYYSKSHKRHFISGRVGNKKQWMECTCSQCCPKKQKQRGGLDVAALASMAKGMDPAKLQGLANGLNPAAAEQMLGKLDTKALAAEAANLGMDPSKIANDPASLLKEYGAANPDQLRELGMGNLADILEKNPELSSQLDKQATGRTYVDPRDSEALRAPLQVTHSWYSRAPLYQVFDSYVCVKKDTLGQVVDLVKILADKKF